METVILSILGGIVIIFIILEVVLDIDTIAGRLISKLTGNHPEVDTREEDEKK